MEKGKGVVASSVPPPTEDHDENKRERERMEKGKGIVAGSVPPPTEDHDENKRDIASLLSGRSAPRNASSKYDFVKVACPIPSHRLFTDAPLFLPQVKVWLGDNADHYYVLSRFLLSRMLTVTKIPNHVAIKIALELKKLLIDNSLLDVYAVLLMPSLHLFLNVTDRYGLRVAAHIDRGLFEKSAPLASTPVWAREFCSSEELITEFCRECRIVRKGLAGDLKKAMKDGKPIIIEGIHLDPSIYLMDEEGRALTDLSKKDEVPKTVPESSKDNIAKPQEFTESNKCNPKDDTNNEGVPSGQVAEVTDCLASVNLAENILENKGETANDPEPKSSKSKSARTEKSAAEPIIVPIVLKMAEFDHKALLEEWISTRTIGDKCLTQGQDRLISNLKTIQDYLCSFEPQGLTVVNISATTFPQTLDRLHSYLLQCIERGISSAPSETTPRSTVS
ncbi:hypothetical protein ACLOJK_033324 [Asimina triloba]